MPQRNPSAEEWARVIRIMENAQLLLRALPADAELRESLQAQVRDLEEAERLLGFEIGKDQFPVPLR